MDEQSRQYFEMMESLSDHPGLKIFLDDLKGYQAAISTQWATIKPEDLRYEQGRFAGLGQAIEQFKMLESIKEQALAAEAAEMPDV